MDLLQCAGAGTKRCLLGSWEHQMPTSTSHSTIADPGRRKGDAPPHHSMLLLSHSCAYALWLHYPPWLGITWFLLGSLQCWLLRPNCQVAAMYGRAQNALTFQMCNLQISLCNWFLCFATLKERITFFWKYYPNLLLASCHFNLTAGVMLHLKVFEGVDIHLCILHTKVIVKPEEFCP